MSAQSLGVLSVLIVCVFFAAVASGTETALTSVNRLRVRHLAEDGSSRAETLQRLQQDPNRFLGTVLIVDPAWEQEPPAQSAFAGIAAQDDPGVAVATMRLSGPAVLISAAASDGAALSRLLDRAL